MTFLEYMTNRIKEERTMVWAILPWNRCKAALEPNKTPYRGRCERLKKHGGDHALERGFDVVWFRTSIVDLKQDWESMQDYAKTDVEATVIMMEKLPYGPPVKPQNIADWEERDKRAQARFKDRFWERPERDPEHDRLWSKPDEERPPPSNGRYYSRKDDERDSAWLAMNPNED